MITEDSLTLVGKVNKTHGIDGELSVSFFAQSVKDAIAPDTCLIFRLDGIFTPFFVATVRPRSAEALLIKIDGLDSQAEASLLVGYDVYMSSAEVADDEDEELYEDADGFYAGQLVGFTAYQDPDDTLIGEIIDVDDTTDNWLFVVERPDGMQVYIPVTDDFITNISTQNHTINFDLPEGLLLL